MEGDSASDQFWRQRTVQPKEEWAVEVDIKQPVDDFYKRIPDMAYKVWKYTMYIM